jgi:hypothetical protein
MGFLNSTNALITRLCHCLGDRSYHLFVQLNGGMLRIIYLYPRVITCGESLANKEPMDEDDKHDAIFIFSSRGSFHMQIHSLGGLKSKLY